MKRIRGIAATLLVTASFILTTGVCEARAGAETRGMARRWALRTVTAAGTWREMVRAIVLARHFVRGAPPEESPSSALPTTSWGQIKDKYKDTVGPIKN